MKDFIKICGALAAVCSLVMLITIANHIVNEIEVEYEDENDNKKEEDKGLVDIEKTGYPQE